LFAFERRVALSYLLVVALVIMTAGVTTTLLRRYA